MAHLVVSKLSYRPGRVGSWHSTWAPNRLGKRRLSSTELRTALVAKEADLWRNLLSGVGAGIRGHVTAASPPSRVFVHHSEWEVMIIGERPEAAEKIELRHELEQGPWFTLVTTGGAQSG